LSAKEVEEAVENAEVKEDMNEVDDVELPDVVKLKEEELEHEKKVEEGQAEETAEDKRKRLLQGYSSLHSAAGAGNTEVLENAIDSGDFDIESTKEGQSPLLIAAKDGQLKTVEVLIKKKANLEATKGAQGGGSAGHTPLHFACFNKHLQVVAALTKAKANVEALANNGTPIIWATAQSAPEVIQILADAKANLNASITKGEGDTAESWTPLLMATKAGDTKIVEILASKKADMEFKLHDGNTALSLSCMLEKMDVAKLLLENKADVEAPVEGLTLLLRAAHAGQTDVINQLVQYKADVNFKTPEGTTALHIATKLKNKDAVDALIQCNADLEKTDDDSLTPLMTAVLHDLSEPCEVLMAKKADVEKTYKGGDTLVHIAASQGFEDMTDQLIKGGCSVNGSNEKGQSPLLLVAASIEKREFKSNERLIKALCEAKADTTVKLDGKKTAVGVLKSRRDEDQAKQLVEVMKPYAPQDFTLAAKARYAAMDMTAKAEAMSNKKAEKA